MKVAAKPDRAQDEFSVAKRIVFTLLIGAITVVSIVIICSLRAADKPTMDQAIADFIDLSSAPSYDPGDFGADGKMSLSSVDYIETSQTDEDDTCIARGTLSYSNGVVTAIQNVTLSYTKGRKGWVHKGDLIQTSLTWSTSRGADTTKVIDQAEALLQNADLALRKSAEEAGADYDFSTTLLLLYRNAKCTVVKESYDGSTDTDTIVLRFDDEGTFVSHVCDLTVVLLFQTDSGSWKLSSCTASEGAKDKSFDSLIGTWEGTFISQTADDSNCYGAQNVALHMTINSVWQTSETTDLTHISCTISGLAHYHVGLTADANETEGDELVKNLEFSGTLTQTGDANDLTFVCVPTNYSSLGTLTLTLDFSTADDTASAKATLTTTFDSAKTSSTDQDTPTTNFSDTYALEKKH